MAAGRKGPVAIAVSGGSDSVALLLCAHDWASRAGRDLLILTVDHGLRPEAAEEAASVVERAAALSHKSRLLTWEGGAPSQAQAREARHRLLAEAAKDAGSELLLLGHTRTDVEETMLMRLARPTTLTASVGPQPVSVSPVWPEGRGLLIGRPLLGLRRPEIMASLSAAGESWISDPSNESGAYERVRIRRLVRGLDEARLHRIAARAMMLRALEDARLAALVGRRVEVDPSGLMSVDLQGCKAPQLLMRRFLALLLQAASGGSRAAPAASVDTLALDVASAGPTSRVTLGGAWIQRRGAELLIGRDPGEARLEWRGGVWDGRYVQGACSLDRPDLPFLVRECVPDAPWKEIVSQRLSVWADALHFGAELGSELAGDYQTPRLSPAQT